MIISINQANFAPLTKANLANRRTTGFYKKVKSGVRLYDGLGKLFAFITANDSGFIVTAKEHEDGKIRYQFALCSNEETRFGYPKADKYSEAEPNLKHLEKQVQWVLVQLGLHQMWQNFPEKAKEAA